MRRKNLYIIVVFLLVANIFVLCAKSSDTQKQEPILEQKVRHSYTYALSQKKPFIVVFYADWCSYCQKFKPVLRLIEAIYSNSFNFVLINGDDKFNKPLLTEYNVSYYPSLYIVDKHGAVKQYISSDKYLDANMLKQELDTYLNVNVEAEQKP